MWGPRAVLSLYSRVEVDEKLTKLLVTNPNYNINEYHETVQVKHGTYANAAYQIVWQVRCLQEH